MRMHAEADREHDTATPAAPAPPVRKFRAEDAGYRWDAVPLKAYKPAGTHFQDITRQTLFGEAEELSSELRYFEVGPGGHSTLERHEHVHAVLILQGRGRVMVGEAVHAIEPFDLVHVPPQTWHQFRADADAPLGFLCLVACDRDRPHRPDADEAEALRRSPHVGDFVRL